MILVRVVGTLIQSLFPSGVFVYHFFLSQSFLSEADVYTTLQLWGQGAIS